MSIILDALRKSEHARQRQSGPGFAEVRTGQRKSPVPPWAAVLFGLLAANAVLLAVLFLRSGESTATTGQAAAPATPPAEAEPAPLAAESAPPPEIPVAADTVQPLPAAAVRSDSRPAVQPLDTFARETRPAAPVAQAPGPEPAAPGPAPRPVPQNAPPDLVSFQELRSSGMLVMPELHLDIHVFSGVPGERFVFINSSKYREGESIEEGPLVDEITLEGVVMTHRGLTFILRRE